VCLRKINPLIIKYLNQNRVKLGRNGEADLAKQYEDAYDAAVGQLQLNRNNF
jgi:hypothetical protein